MDKADIKLFAEAVGSKFELRNAKWANVTCPLRAWRHEHGTDNEPSFGVKIEKAKVSGMYCLSCGWGGALGTLMFELKVNKAPVDYATLVKLSSKEEEEQGLVVGGDDDEPDPSILHPFPSEWLESFPSVFNSGLGLHYLRGREGGPVPDAVIAALDLRWQPYGKRVCFPCRGQDKKVYGLHGRAISPNTKPPYLVETYYGKSNPQVLTGEDRVDWDRPVVLAESVFDMARAYQAYRNTLTGRSASITPAQLDRMLEAGEIITMFDPDKAGANARKKVDDYVAWKAPYTVVRHLHLPDGFDGGKMTPEGMAEELAAFVELDDLLLTSA